jgi:putative transposase
MDNDHSERMALFRYSVISSALDAGLSATERGLIVRALANRTWTTPTGEERSFSRGTIDRWVAAYRSDGLGGLAPNPRTDRGQVRVETQWMAEAVRLRREVPARSGAQIIDIIGRAHGVWLKERTVRAHLARAGVSRRALTAEPAKAFGRYEASRRNERWIGDVLVGPFVPHPRKAGSKRAKLFVLVDDYSRLLVCGRWMTEENTRAGQEVLRAAIMRRGIPTQLYMDNGSPYRAGQLARTCAVLGIHVVHSKPYSPEGRGKQERLNRYIRERFLTEAEATGIDNFEDLNDRFGAWAEQVANTRVHAETKQKPIERFLAAAPIDRPSPEQVAEAFRWSVVRRVRRPRLSHCSRIATRSIHR